MKKNNEETLEVSVALRYLTDSVGLKWYRMLKEDYTGLGHIHDLWNEMHHDMECIVALEKFIVENDEKGGGVNFLPVIGFPQYNAKEGEQNEND